MCTGSFAAIAEVLLRVSTHIFFRAPQPVITANCTKSSLLKRVKLRQLPAAPLGCSHNARLYQPPTIKNCKMISTPVLAFQKNLTNKKTTTCLITTCPKALFGAGLLLGLAARALFATPRHKKAFETLNRKGKRGETSRPVEKACAGLCFGLGVRP